MALLDRVLQRGPSGSSPEDFDDARMTILEHLQDLRRVLIVSMIAWALGTAIAFAFWPRILEFLIQRGAVKHLVYLGPPGALTLGLKIALFVGIVVAAPVWIQQLWWFVSPGLHQKEKRLILPLILATIAFFAIGVAFALFSLPLFLRILNGFAPPDLSYLGVADEYDRDLRARADRGHQVEVAIPQPLLLDHRARRDLQPADAWRRPDHAALHVGSPLRVLGSDSPALEAPW